MLQPWALRLLLALLPQALLQLALRLRVVQALLPLWVPLQLAPRGVLRRQARLRGPQQPGLLEAQG